MKYSSEGFTETYANLIWFSSDLFSLLKLLFFIKSSLDITIHRGVIN